MIVKENAAEYGGTTGRMLRELKRLVAEGESEAVEFKESLQEEALQTVGAFANARGGILLIGVNDSGVPVGTVAGKATFLKKHINVRFVITGKPQRDQIWDYPLAALWEAVVNAICHRDYGDTADIQIKVFDDSIRIWSPGLLPYGGTIEDLYRRTHASKPRNRLIAQVFYDLEIIERYGSGIHRMLDACKAAGLPEPTLGESTGGFLITFHKATAQVAPGGVADQVAPQVTPQVTAQVTAQVGKVVRACVNPLTREELQRVLELAHREHFRKAYLLPALDSGFIERTIPDKPQSRLQKYRLTPKGRAVLEKPVRKR